MKLTALLFMLLMGGIVCAQDRIYLKTRPDSIVVKILEVNSTEVKYKFPNDSFPILYFPKSEVRRIVLANGTVLDLEKEEELNPDLRVSSVKFAFLGPIFNQLGFSYERYVSNRMSYEFNLTGIGFGHNLEAGYEEPFGGYARFGVKWMTTSGANIKTNPERVLTGFYIKPEITYGQFKIDYTDDNYYSYYYSRSYPDKQVYFGSLMLNMGYQCVFRGGFTLDTYLGLGYFISKESPSRSNSSWYYNNYGKEYYHYAFMAFDNDLNPLAISMGVKLGYTFTTKKK
jgi:hypothetical protein